MSLPTKQAAAESEAWLTENVLVPALLEKLATVHGVRPQQPAEVRQLLQMGAMLAERHRNGQYKTAAEARAEQPNDFLSHALNALGAPQGGSAPQFNDTHVKQAALELVRKNQLGLNAALIYDHVSRGGALAEETNAAA